MLAHHAFAPGPRPRRVQALNVWIALVERRGAWAGVRSSADSALSGASAAAEADSALEAAAIGGVAAHIDGLAALLAETPYGRLAPPLGSARMSAVALAAVLLRTGAPLAEELAVRVRLLPACLQLFLHFPFNSILHHQVLGLLAAALEAGSDALVGHLLGECNLPGWLASAPVFVTPLPREGDARAGERAQLRAGYAGHLTVIANQLANAATRRPAVHAALKAHAAWQAYVVDQLGPRNELENVGAWAAGRPCAPGRYGSVDTDGPDFLAASELQLAGLSEANGEYSVANGNNDHDPFGGVKRDGPLDMLGGRGQGLVVRALPASSLDEDDDMQWEAADALGDAADHSGLDYGAADAAGPHDGRGPEDLEPGAAAGSPPSSWEDRHELYGSPPGAERAVSTDEDAAVVTACSPPGRPGTLGALDLDAAHESRGGEDKQGFTPGLLTDTPPAGAKLGAEAGGGPDAGQGPDAEEEMRQAGNDDDDESGGDRNSDDDMEGGGPCELLRDESIEETLVVKCYAARLKSSVQGFASSTDTAANKAKEAASDVASKASASASKAGEAVGASQAGAADASRKATGAAAGLGDKAKEAASSAGQKVQGVAAEAKSAASEYAGKAQGAAAGAKDAATAAGHKAGASAAGAAGTAAGTAQAKAGGMPLWALAAGGAAGGLAIYYGLKASPGSHGDKAVDQKVEETRGAVTVEKPAVIATFEVIGADGKPVTLDDLAGDFALIAFGNAKDKELTESKLMRLKDIIAASDKKSNVQYTKAAFVSDDPDNDKPEALAKLLQSVGAVGQKSEQRIMALTGPQVDRIKRAAFVLTARAGEEGKPEPAPGTDSSLYLVNPEHEFTVVYEDKASVEEVADSVAKQILNYKRTHGGWHAVKAVKPRVA
ncbi:hypothetical protein WJX81_000047 [Elliptochloris bilobata]|uniref:Uncharacterized protein n=1 Tax=Elliptochloris bilobata TaxID=381761 RepID=A0AAW1RER6_9CHLO